MRSDYSLTQSLENEATFEELSNNNEEFISARDAITGIGSLDDLVQKMPFTYSLDFTNLLTSPRGSVNSYVNGESPYVLNFFVSFFHFK